MAPEFRERSDGGQKPASDHPAGAGGARIAIGLAVAVALLTLLAWLRWERPRDLAPGVPVPAFARLVSDPDLEPPPGDGCRATLLLRESPDAAAVVWERAVTEAGWQPVGAESDSGDGPGNAGRRVYRRQGARLLAGLDADPGGTGSRLRLTFRPCPPEMAAAADPRIVRGRS